MPLQIEPSHKKIVVEILNVELGGNVSQVYAFGSRAKNTAHAFSDLDLVFKGEIPKFQLAKLKERFEESNLPYKVDFVIWSQLDENFQDQIKNDLLQFSNW